MIETISLLSSSAVPVNVDDRLRLIFRNITGNNLTGYLRVLFENQDGSLGWTSEEVSIASSAGTTAAYFPLFPGRLLYVSLTCGNSTIQAGTLWVEISIIHGSVNAISQILYLTSGNLETESFIAFPYNSPLPPSNVIPGTITPTINDPAAGSGFFWDPSSISTAELIAGAFTFTADANAANRTISVTFDSAGSSIVLLTSRTNITATQTRRIIFWRGDNIPTDTTTAHYIPIPIDLRATQLVVTVTANNMQAGDTFTAINLLVTQVTNPT